MILTGVQIQAEVEQGRVVIDPFTPSRIEPNSYGFALGATLLTYTDTELDARRRPSVEATPIPGDGMVLEPGRLYLGETAEVMGSPVYASTLHANRSTASMGMWIQFSADLGHTGAVIPWTLEIRVAHRLVVVPGMPIGKIAFWSTLGPPMVYSGRYAGSTGVCPSGLSTDFSLPQEPS
ncbi:dCTP deaminase [Nocardia higoensis]|uniref:dCTP deaminase n=1 Tax=Nocardia higoensis TaxID=228599 RepID=UPI000594138F|nr:deoxycytidine triphosphate deaminase [Nocardia higoensis]